MGTTSTPTRPWRSCGAARPSRRCRFLQGLIQWAVAFEHHRRGNSHGARVLLDRALANLEGAPPGYMGVDISACRSATDDLRRAFAAWDAGGPRPPVAAPRIAVGAERPPAVD